MEIFNELCEVDTLHSVNGARIFIDLVSLTFETKTILSRVWLVDFFHVHSEDSLRRSDVGTDFSKNRKNKKEKGDRDKRRGNTRIRDYQPSNGKVCSSLENKLSSEKDDGTIQNFGMCRRSGLSDLKRRFPSPERMRQMSPFCGALSLSLSLEKMQPSLFTF